MTSHEWCVKEFDLKDMRYSIWTSSGVGHVTICGRVNWSCDCKYADPMTYPRKNLTISPDSGDVGTSGEYTRSGKIGGTIEVLEGPCTSTPGGHGSRRRCTGGGSFRIDISAGFNSGNFPGGRGKISDCIRQCGKTGSTPTPIGPIYTPWIPPDSSELDCFLKCMHGYWNRTTLEAFIGGLLGGSSPTPGVNGDNVFTEMDKYWCSKISR